MQEDLVLDGSTRLPPIEESKFPSDVDSGPLSGVTRSLSLAAKYAFDSVHSDGHWCGELLSNVTITAEHVFFCQSLKMVPIPDSDAYRRYLLSQQNQDGSWGIAPDYPGDVSTTAEAYLALKILGVVETVPVMLRARDFVRAVGGLATVRIFTRIYFAQFGLFPWTAVPQIPAEFILMPAQSPINVYRISSWARSTLIPLLIIRHHQPIHALPNGQSANNDFLDELWLDAHRENKLVPYCPPLSRTWRSDFVGSTFAAIDNLLYYLGGLRNVPLLRSYARRQCVNWILSRQEIAGDWAGIIPPMHAGIQALLLEGFDLADPRIRRGIDAIERFAWQDQAGKRIQACVSPVWDTVLMIRALCDAGVDPNDEHLRRAVAWTTDRQILGLGGDWRIYNPRLAPGGYSFEYHNTWYPDVDDTAAAILAFVSQDPRSVEANHVIRAAKWILGMQCREGGWAAFDLDNDRLFLNKIPFSDMNSLCDPNTADVTGRVLEAFGLMLREANTCKQYFVPDLLDRMISSCDRAILYLAHTQESSGAWYGRWGSNYIYGTSNVLCGLAYFAGDNCLVQDLVHAAVQWLKFVQNADGGWGEDLASYRDPSRAGRGASTASQTAWALMGLLANNVASTDESIRRGVTYLVRSQTETTPDGGGASWPEHKYTGTGFPGHFYLRYSYYRHYFPMMALGRYMKAARSIKDKPNEHDASCEQ